MKINTNTFNHPPPKQVSI